MATDQMLKLSLCLICVVFIGCSNEAPPEPLAQENFSKNLYSANTNRLSIQVFYEPRAIPFTGAIAGTANDTWDITQSSLDGLFLSHPGKQVSVPKTLAEMNILPEQPVQIWDVLRLITTAQQFHVADATPTTSTLSVFFMDGLFLGDPKALGVHFDGTPFVFIFKDAISLASGYKVQRYLEQSAVTHQLGHAMGLVNDGIPMTVAHEDPTHPEHSVDTNDVMHWNLEGQETALPFVNAAATANRLNLFGVQSLQDSQNFKP